MRLSRAIRHRTNPFLRDPLAWTLTTMLLCAACLGTP
jgi:hypothetical protein